MTSGGGGPCSWGLGISGCYGIPETRPEWRRPSLLGFGLACIVPGFHGIVGRMAEEASFWFPQAVVRYLTGLPGDGAFASSGSYKRWYSSRLPGAREAPKSRDSKGSPGSPYPWHSVCFWSSYAFAVTWRPKGWSKRYFRFSLFPGLEAIGDKRRFCGSRGTELGLVLSRLPRYYL